MLVKGISQVTEKITQIFAALDLALKVTSEGCGLTLVCLVTIWKLAVRFTLKK